MTHTTTTSSRRIAAIDVLRALTMFLMLFVNDIPGLKGVPHWLFHAEYNEDMLGFSDLIFPAFLFCVGMSIPFAIENRLKRGNSELQVLVHILSRTFALVMMGLFTLNCEEGTGGLSYELFSFIMILGIFLVWLDYPRRSDAFRFVFIALKTIGALLLVGLIVYSDMAGRPFHVGWWGILGLIGWTYLVCAVIYLFTRKRLLANLIVWVVVIALCVLNQSEVIPYDYFSRAILLPFVPGGWTHHALGMSGIVASLLLRHFVSRSQLLRLVVCFVVLGLVMLVLGFWAHPYWIISKIQATPTWLFFCLAVNFIMLAFVYWLTDMLGKARWFSLIAPAGTATLTCYLIPYVWYPLRGMYNLHLPWSWYYGLGGIAISLVYSLLVVQIARGLVKCHIKVKI